MVIYYQLHYKYIPPYFHTLEGGGDELHTGISIHKHVIRKIFEKYYLPIVMSIVPL